MYWNDICFMVTPKVVDAMRQTVTNMIGTLPPQFFAVTVTTVSLLLSLKHEFRGFVSD